MKLSQKAKKRLVGLLLGLLEEDGAVGDNARAIMANMIVGGGLEEEVNEDADIPEDEVIFRTAKNGKVFAISPESGDVSGLGPGVDNIKGKSSNKGGSLDIAGEHDTIKSGGRNKSAKILGSENKRSVAKNHEYDGSGYKGNPGEVSSGKNGGMKPKSDGAKRISCDDAVGEMEKYKSSGGKEGRKINSLTGHIDENGNLSPERQKVHDEIIQNFFKDKIPFDGKPTMIMSGGGPASGKSFIEKGARKNFGDDSTITVDPDKIKEMLPGYTDMAIKTDDAAGHYHEESSALAKRIYQYAVENGLNVVYDGTGDGSVGSVMKKIKTARDAGYAVKGQYVTVDLEGESGALARNMKRYESGKKKFESGESDVPPRLPKEEHVRKIHAAVSDIVPSVANFYDEFELWDNNVPQGAPRRKIATCKRGGEIQVEKGMEDLVQRFFDKGKQGYKLSNGKVGQ